MNIRFLRIPATFLCVVSWIHAVGMDLRNGNLLLTSDNLIVQVNRTGDVVDGVFTPSGEGMGIGLNPNGDILIALTTYQPNNIQQRVYRADAFGRIIDTNVPPFAFESFAVAPNGDFLFGKGATILRADSAFNFLDAFSVPPAPGSAPCINGIGLGVDGEIYVIALAQNPPRTSFVHRLDASGRLVQSLGPFAHEVYGVAVDADRHIFCTVKTNDNSGFGLPSQVLELDENGLELNSFLAPFQVKGITLINFIPPRLSIRCAANEVILQWPTSPYNFHLESACLTSPDNWNAVGISPSQLEGVFEVKLPLSASGWIFRLKN